MGIKQWGWSSNGHQAVGLEQQWASSSGIGAAVGWHSSFGRHHHAFRERQRLIPGAMALAVPLCPARHVQRQGCS